MCEFCFRRLTVRRLLGSSSIDPMEVLVLTLIFSYLVGLLVDRFGIMYATHPFRIAKVTMSLRQF